MRRGAPEVTGVELPRDSVGFTRRECPECQRPFKTRPGPMDSRAVLHKLLGFFPFENAHECVEGIPVWGCPYCGYRAEADAFLTPAQQGHLEAVARAWANHVRYEQLAHVARTLSVNPRPTFVAVEPEALPGPMEPEPDELLRVMPMLCCGEEVKVVWEWDQALHCFSCGARHDPMSGRQQVELRFVSE
ncbi:MULTISPECIES: hypothetical protein [Myxococcus]|uniref:Uncharacterized protein n=1 Tax=Myxococcus xanthus TaxID=34 RepID=A0AAE6G048_MYXXA|nr:MULTISPECIES: hypothetical protein [Myxococcus]QDE68449.1 hypothetical protein BHS09_16465 [Myxococcus xanthus]QDE75726.1 hypothetical protein BHS08_16480 [Myxococcus xanthus]QDE83054.1 hypothetical protein BHS07_16640 [Myxococcus xanthus]QDE97297.1 hypothetical protein BHS05_16375 [Myxococcus xanthus]QDF04863.1 hypothetical protein BHS04_16870 [Myxococcus xanthus]